MATTIQESTKKNNDNLFRYVITFSPLSQFLHNDFSSAPFFQKKVLRELEFEQLLKI